jgi:hypothetical protein
MRCLDSPYQNMALCRLIIPSRQRLRRSVAKRTRVGKSCCPLQQLITLLPRPAPLPPNPHLSRVQDTGMPGHNEGNMQTSCHHRSDCVV